MTGSTETRAFAQGRDLDLAAAAADAERSAVPGEDDPEGSSRRSTSWTVK
jgi:hypothetical protein